MNSLMQIIIKNFKILFRSKTAALVVILGPLLLVSLLGVAFSTTEPYYINIGAYSDKYNDMADSLITKLSDGQFMVKKYPNEEACVDSVRQGKSNVCMIFPPNLAVGKEGSSEILFRVDFSDINLVYNVIEVISERLAEESREISAKLTTDLLTRLAYSEGEVDKHVPSVVRLAIENDNMAKKTQDVYQSLKSLDLRLNTELFNANEIQAQFDMLMTIAVDTLFDANYLVTKIEKELSALEVDTTSIDSVIDDSESKFSQRETELHNANETVGQLVGGLSDVIVDTRTQMLSASSARKSMSTNLQEMLEILNSNLDKLNKIQTGLNNIKKTTSAVEITSAESIVSPISTRIVPITSRQTHYNYLFPTLLMLVTMFTGILLGSALIIVEKRSTAFFRNWITPLNNYVFLLGTYLTALIILAVQIFIFLIISSFFFDTLILGVIFSTLLVLFLFASLSIFIGIFIGLAVKSAETASLASVSIGGLFFLMSSTILPIESMPMYLRKAVQWNPYVIGESLLKETILFRLGFADITTELLILISYALVIILISIYLMRNLMRIRGGMTAEGGIISWVQSCFRDEIPEAPVDEEIDDEHIIEKTQPKDVVERELLKKD